MKIYITRHGTTEWNNSRRLQGWKDSDLTREGVESAIKLGKKLSPIDFDIIYSSPLNRALTTAKLIRGNKDIKIVTHNGLREMCYGIWEGMTLEDINRKYPEEYFLYVNKPEEYIPIDGETYNDLFTRVQNFLNEIVNEEAENVLVVTHGVTIKAMIAIIKGLTIKEFSNLPIFTGTSLNICEIKDGKIELIVEDNVSHLS